MAKIEKDRSPDIVVMVYDPRAKGQSVKVRVTAETQSAAHFAALDKVSEAQAVLAGISVAMGRPVEVVRS